MITPFSEAATRLAALIRDNRRILLGLAGPPGSGKSTLAGRLAMDAAPGAVVVPMDGFHLANAELTRLDRADRKGAPDTFDAAGFVNLLRRIRNDEEATVYAPRFQREIEEPIAGAIPVSPEDRLIVIEGNYLLCDGPWAPVRELMDEIWYVDTHSAEQDAWLLARHMTFGRSREEAREWIDRTDAANARVIEATRDKADWIIFNSAKVE